MATHSDHPELTPAGTDSHPAVIRSPGIVLLATTTIALASLPGWLIGAMAVQMATDLEFGPTALGLAVGSFLLVAGLLSIPGSLIVQRVGWRRSLVLVGAGTILANTAIATLARTWGQLMVWLMVAAAMNALAGPAVNLSIVEMIDRARHGWAFARKQAAVPIATLCAGLAVPAVAQTVGWRWSFIGVAVGALALVSMVWLLGLRSTPATPRVTRRNRWEKFTGRELTSLLLLGSGAGMACAACGSLGGFLVSYAHVIGETTSRAGTILAVGSLISVVARLALGWWVDLRPRRPLSIIVLMLIVGSLGFSLIALPGTTTLMAGAALAFGLGWAWNGLFHMAVMRHYATHAARATGVVQTFMFIGTGIGPIAFGLLAEGGRFSLAWLGAGGVMLVGSVLMALARARLFRTIG